MYLAIGFMHIFLKIQLILLVTPRYSTKTEDKPYHTLEDYLI